MSEVNEKKARKAAAAAEQAKKDKAFKRNVIIIVVVLALVVACACVINSDLFYTSTTAVQIGNTKYSPAEYNFYFNSIFNNAYNNIYSQYGELTPYIINTEAPLDEQIYMFGDGQMTWAEYLHNQTISEMSNVAILYDAAIENGYTLSDEDIAEIDQTLAVYETNAVMYGYSSADSFLAGTFGKGVDAKLFRQIAEMQALATKYSADLNDSFSYTSDELSAYYAEHKDEFDFFSYHAYFVSTGDQNFTDLSDEERITAAAEAAAAIAEATTGEEFTAKVRDFVVEDLKGNYEETTDTLSIVQGGNLSDDIKDWVLDESRTEGDTTVIDVSGGTYVLMYVSRNDNNYNAVNARHILVEAKASEDGTYSDEALAAAKEQAEEILAEYELNPTEEYFAELAKTYSTDDGSKANGGLYENIFKDQMVEEFDAFLFEEHRLPGDTAIVYGNNGSYAGYHVMYYVGEAGLYCDTLAETALRAEDYNEAVSALAQGYEVTEGFGMRFAGN